MVESKRIADIVVGERFRQEMGDIAALANSISTFGLLQPIGVTSDNELVFGERRLRAAESLGWQTITASIIDIASIADGQYHENKLRKDFTCSERVALVKAIERRSRGQPKKNSENLPNTFLTREQIAKRVGLGNSTTARQAIFVVDRGIPELVAAMDSGTINIEPAFAIATQPAERQAEIIKLPVPERRAALRDIDRPGGENRKKSHPTKKPTKSPRVTIDPPYRFVKFPSREETGYPAEGASLAEHHAFFEKHGRTPLLTRTVRERSEGNLKVMNLVAAVSALARDTLPNAEDLFDCFALAAEVNASHAREMLTTLEARLPKALALLNALDVKLKERSAAQPGQPAESACA